MSDKSFFNKNYSNSKININDPVSLLLIVPKIIGPIILLFGEKHVQLSKGCTDNPDDYKQQFKEFLTKLDDLASNEEFSIEFYKEQLEEEERKHKFCDYILYKSII